MTTPAQPRWRVRPALGNVLILPLREEDVTKSGIILVSAIEKETFIGEVVEVCEPYHSALADRSIIPDGPVYKVGDLVVIGKYNGRDIVIRQPGETERTKYIIIRESDVLGKLEEEYNDKPESSEGTGGASPVG